MVVPWRQLGTANVPGGGGLRLMQRGTEFSIMAGTNELMNSRLSGSEAALATLACEKLTSRKQPRLLIGGLGMGFTLRAAAAVLGAEASIVVAELVPEVIAWARGPLQPVFGTSLDDPRVSLRESDVGPLIATGKAGYDAILLDVDNGPDGLTRRSNDRLYSLAGLAAAHAALRPGGVLAVWSAAPDAAFSQRLKAAGFSVEEVNVRANGAGRGARHVIWLALR